MAKRKSTRSQANDSGSAATPAQPSNRSRGAAAPEADTIAAYPDVERTENDDEALNRASGNTQPASAASGETPQPKTSAAQNDAASTNAGPNAQPRREPSVEDIRHRAYHRYLERGGGEGMQFDDWLEAERELKNNR
jgi:hypothetical protein